MRLDLSKDDGIQISVWLNSDNKTGEVMATAVHENIVSLLQEFLMGMGVKAPNVAICLDITFVPRHATSTVISRPPADTDENPHARIICEIANDDGKTFLPRNAKMTEGFGKHTGDPICDKNDPALYNALNDPRFQINILISNAFFTSSHIFV
ncbi:hypothetical protein GLOIN_2v1734856 [Rhizophagus clarus]|uniref:Uncharacterized protein n=1 Tax=Rhizophagus clarus TaxID=94130 RepID=A0A8H3L6S6_9GLOM|nr:hypothetical protein GLOIN_2v1734856 [Rhizophagus clarus]